MKLLGAGVLVALLASAPVVSIANAPTQSLRPLSRPTEGVVSKTSPVSSEPRLMLVPVYYSASVRPVPRPVALGGTAPLKKSIPMTKVVTKTTVTMVASNSAVEHSLRPLSRPEGHIVTKSRATTQQEVVTLAAVKAPQSVPTSNKGSICGSSRIRGQTMSAIPGKIKGCGVKNPVSVTSVAGIPLSRAATMDCNTAITLHNWVEKGVKPAVGRLGGGVARIDVISGYSCRTRNNQKGKRISEHGKGKAVDISGITLANGVSISVLKGWNSKAQGKLLRAMHKSACGPFGTVLGPSANSFHRDHFHFDTAKYRSGSYCK
ncbi:MULTISPECIES: extensin family protein [Falsihalocynthiibacter]|uniref:extensin-like domain-containing protein n=1 Tax=Falsihalocynthiibacter TaxID=2854182 RepID=UPI0030036180